MALSNREGTMAFAAILLFFLALALRPAMRLTARGPIPGAIPGPAGPVRAVTPRAQAPPLA